VQPLSSPGKAVPDPQLYGVWVAHEEGENLVYLHVGADEEGMTKALWVEYGKDAAYKLSHYRAFPTRIDDMTLLNVISLDEHASAKGYNIVRYHIESDHSLSLALMSEDAVRQDIKDGKLKGKIKPGNYGDTLITASSSELRAYIKAADPSKLFGKPLKFERAADVGSL
jgi:hypothetical protein